MAVLGVLLVVAGGTIIVLRALADGSKPQSAVEGAPDDLTTEVPVVPAAERAPHGATRVARAARRLPAADRLIGWGIVLLILAAISAGAISLSFSIQAGGQ